MPDKRDNEPRCVLPYGRHDFRRVTSWDAVVASGFILSALLLFALIAVAAIFGSWRGFFFVENACVLLGGLLFAGICLIAAWGRLSRKRWPIGTRDIGRNADR